MNDAIDWVRLSQQLQKHMTDLVHKGDRKRYGDEFYAEALRRALGYRPADDTMHEQARGSWPAG